MSGSKKKIAIDRVKASSGTQACIKAAGNIVSSTFDHFLSVDAAIMASKNCCFHFPDTNGYHSNGVTC